jgi:hemerythrin
MLRVTWVLSHVTEEDKEYVRNQLWTLDTAETR